MTFVATLMALVCAPSSAGEPRSVANNSLDVAMQKQQRYFSEHCLELAQDDRLTVDVESPYPVDFNIHHHTDTTTEYPVEQRVESHYRGAFSLPTGGEYCFMWQNPESRPADFTIRLHYTVSGA